MSEDLVKQFESLLQDNALQYSLGKEALQRTLEELKSLKKQVKDITSRKEYYEKEYGRSETRFNELEVKYENEHDRVRRFEKREVELAERELACLGLEIKNEYEQRRGDEFKDLMHATVRNTEVQRRVLQGIRSGNENTYDANNNNTGVNTFQDATTDTITETKT